MRRKVQGEVVWRVTYLIDATDKKPRPSPVILILADKQGWQRLADEFMAMSRRTVPKSMIAVGDPEDHQHVNAAFFPMINRKLSHPLELRLGLLTPRTRTRVFRKYGLEKPPKSDADMRSLFHRLIGGSNKQIRGMKW